MIRVGKSSKQQAGQGRRGPVPGMSRDERDARDREIQRLRAKGYAIPDLAVAYGLSERQIRDILKSVAKRQGKEMMSAGPETLLAEIAAGYDEDIRELSALINSNNHPNIKLGALKARVQARSAWVAVIQSLGFLPVADQGNPSERIVIERWHPQDGCTASQVQEGQRQTGNVTILGGAGEAGPERPSH